MNKLTLLVVLGLFMAGCNQADRQAYVREDHMASSPMEMGQGDMGTMMKQCNQIMESHLGNADPAYDRRFIDMMIPHHEGAVQMAQDALEKAQHPEIRQMAQKVIKDQQKEIEQLQAWRKQWYGQDQATNP